MRVLSVAAALVLVAACSNQDRNASLEKMGEAVTAYNGGQVTKARRLLKEAAMLYPENHRAWFNLGEIHRKQESFEKAVEAYSSAVKYKGDDAMYHYRLGESQLKNGDLSLAETHLERAVELNERLYGAWSLLGDVYNRTDRPERAAKAWTKACKLNPMYGPPFADLGYLYIRWDKLDEAISVLDQGRLHVKDGDALAEILYFLGLAHQRDGNYDEAIDAYTKALEVRRGHLLAKLQRGFAHADAGHVDKAKKDLEEFVDSGGGGDSFLIQAANDRLMRLTASP